MGGSSHPGGRGSPHRSSSPPARVAAASSPGPLRATGHSAADQRHGSGEAFPSKLAHAESPWAGIASDDQSGTPRGTPVRTIGNQLAWRSVRSENTRGAGGGTTPGPHEARSHRLGAFRAPNA